MASKRPKKKITGRQKQTNRKRPKRPQSEATHTKRSQASKKRRRVKGKFADELSGSGQMSLFSFGHRNPAKSLRGNIPDQNPGNSPRTFGNPQTTDRSEISPISNPREVARGPQGEEIPTREQTLRDSRQLQMHMRSGDHKPGKRKPEGPAPSAEEINLSEQGGSKRLKEELLQMGISPEHFNTFEETYRTRYNQLGGRQGISQGERKRLAIEEASKALPEGAYTSAMAFAVTGANTTTRNERDRDLYGDEDKPGDFGRVHREELWRTHRDTVKYRPKMSGPTVAQSINARTLSRVRPEEVLNQLVPSHRDELARLGLLEYKTSAQGEETAVPNNVGNAYLRALGATNASHNELMQWLEEGGHHLKDMPTLSGPFSGRGTAGARELAQRQLDQERYQDTRFIEDPFSDDKGTHNDFAFGIRNMSVPSLEELRSKYPDATPEQLLAFRESGRETMQQHMLEANERASFETRQAAIKAKGNKGNIEAGDQVVVATTNLGQPTFTVDADSFVGRYVLAKRKRMMLDDKTATRAQLKGLFPAAVRDQHLMEIGYGVSLGATGRMGLFSETGARFGKHRTKGYKNKTPLGKQVLRDKSGLPIYDSRGNVRYTDGFTKPYELGTDRALGFRVFLG